MSAVDNVGNILIQVQEEVHQLREKVQAKNNNGNQPINVEELDNALAKTEKELQNTTAQFAHQLNNNVKTIASAILENQPRTEVYHNEFCDAVAEDLSQNDQKKQQDSKPWYNSLNSESLLPQRHAIRLSPGQRFKHGVALKAVANPLNEKNRDILHDNYGIQLPVIPDKKQTKVVPLTKKKIVTGSTIERLTPFPRANRFDPLLTPPPITEKDAQKGLLSLLQRGLIPPSTEITLEPPPVELKPIPYSEGSQKKKKVIPAIIDFGGPTVSEGIQSQRKSASTRVSSSYLSTVTLGASKVKKLSENTREFTPSSGTLSSKRTSKDGPLLSAIPYAPPTTPSSPAMMYKLAIQDGKTRLDTAEFKAFKHCYQNEWGRISTLMEYLEDLLTNHSIPFAFVNSCKLIDLVEVIDIERVPDIEDLIGVFINAKEIKETMNSKGQRYRGMRGRIFAAITIQTNWRRIRERRKFLNYRKMKWASGVCAIAWLMRLRAMKNREMLQQTRADNVEAFRNKTKIFKSSWNRIKNSRRVIVHIPSLGYSEDIRLQMNNLHVDQNNQIARICSVLDPNVDVIYVSPITVTDEAKQYYHKLLSLKSAINSGDVKQVSDISSRITFIVPEVITHFSKKSLCLSSMLKYSPTALKRIKHLIKGRDAYIVPGLMHIDDLDVARSLDIPILGTEPRVAHLYSTKSGAKRIFEHARVDTPPGKYDIYSQEQLYEAISELIIHNVKVKRWLFKSDSSVSANGIAYCDIISHLSCYSHLLKEKERYGRDWVHKWTHEGLFHELVAEIPHVLYRHAKPINKALYPDWKSFIAMFLTGGGIIEAYPTAESVTVLQAEMMIEPDGQVRLLCIGDQISGSSVFQPWGISIPQSSIDANRANSVCKKVGASCQSRNIIGYLSLTMVTFIHQETLEQMLWCLDMSLKYTDNVAMFELFCFMTTCSLDTQNHELTIPQEEASANPNTACDKFTTIKPNESSLRRFGVMSTKMYHSNLSIIHYSVLFQLCRAHGIGYDIKEKQGTVFMLIDYLYRGHLGLLVVSDELPKCFTSFGRTLNILHQEVSSPKMQGISNFKEAIVSIKEIIGTAMWNAKDDDDEEFSNDKSEIFN